MTRLVCDLCGCVFRRAPVTNKGSKHFCCPEHRMWYVRSLRGTKVDKSTFMTLINKSKEVIL